MGRHIGCLVLIATLAGQAVGLVAIAGAGGALYPPLLGIAGPFVCPGGELAYRAGQLGGGATCTAAGQASDVGPLALLVAGLIYGEIVATLILAPMLYGFLREARASRHEL